MEFFRQQRAPHRTRIFSFISPRPRDRFPSTFTVYGFPSGLLVAALRKWSSKGWKATKKKSSVVVKEKRSNKFRQGLEKENQWNEVKAREWRVKMMKRKERKDRIGGKRRTGNEKGKVTIVTELSYLRSLARLLTTLDTRV